ncbi:MAG: helix-hairpin-helix domain-containing protein [Limnochordales bacterium]|nr:helix-hairpin-helix domain-containing protein [Limnochordales bacterium]
MRWEWYWCYRHRQRALIVGLAVLLAVLLIPAGVVGTRTAPASDRPAELWVKFIDVGQGAAVLIRTPEDRFILVDGGERQAGEQVLLPYLSRLGVKQLDLVVATHPHSDHIGGLLPVLERVPVGRVLADGQVHTSYTYESFLRLIERKRIPFELARAGKQLEVGSVRLLVLHPAEPLLPSGLNSNSVVLRIEYGQVAFLLTGDLDIPGEAAVLRRKVAPATVLQVAHHGSSDSTSCGWLKAVQPAIVVIQSGAGNPYGHPHRETLQRLAACAPRARIYRNDQHGTVTLITDGREVRVETEKTPPGTSKALDTDRLPSSNRLDLNRATREELEALPGIGPVLAQRIIDYRQEHPFVTVDQLLEIKGIGPKLLETLRPLVMVGQSERED